MCFFHNWNLWSEPREVKMSLNKFGVDYQEVTRTIQSRTCSKCGKYQWREV